MQTLCLTEKTAALLHIFSYFPLANHPLWRHSLGWPDRSTVAGDPRSGSADPSVWRTTRWKFFPTERYCHWCGSPPSACRWRRLWSGCGSEQFWLVTPVSDSLVVLCSSKIWSQGMRSSRLLLTLFGILVEDWFLGLIRARIPCNCRRCFLKSTA